MRRGHGLVGQRVVGGRHVQQRARAPARRPTGRRARRRRPGRPAPSSIRSPPKTMGWPGSSAIQSARTVGDPGHQAERTNGVATTAPGERGATDIDLHRGALVDVRRQEGQRDAVARARARSCRWWSPPPPGRRRRTGHSARGGRRPSVAIPRSSRATPRSRSASSASRPRNVGFVHETTHPRPACSGVMPGPSSWPCSGQRRPPGAVCRGRPGRPAARRRRERPATGRPRPRPAPPPPRRRSPV